MKGATYVLQLPDLPHYPLNLPIILALQFVQHSITILSPTPPISLFYFPILQLTTSSATTDLEFGVAGLYPGP